MLFTEPVAEHIGLELRQTGAFVNLPSRTACGYSPRTMNRVLIFAERMLPSTQAFIPIQVNALKKFEPQYVGLIPAQPGCTLNIPPILLTNSRSLGSRV